MGIMMLCTIEQLEQLLKSQSNRRLDTISGRATPAQWAKYTVAFTAIKLINQSNTRLTNELRSRMYINDRVSRKCKFFNSARTKVGQHLDCHVMCKSLK